MNSEYWHGFASFMRGLIITYEYSWHMIVGGYGRWLWGLYYPNYVGEHQQRSTGNAYEPTSIMKPKCSMYGIFATIYPKNHPNVGKYTIHGSYGKWHFGSEQCSISGFRCNDHAKKGSKLSQESYCIMATKLEWVGQVFFCDHPSPSLRGGQNIREPKHVFFRTCLMEANSRHVVSMFFLQSKAFKGQPASYLPVGQDEHL